MNKNFIKKFMAFLLVIALVFATHSAYCDDSNNAANIAVITPLKKGQIAPFTGVELSPLAAANIAADYDAFSERIKIEVEQAVGKEKAQSTFAINQLKITSESDKKILQAQFDAKTKQVQDLIDQLMIAEAKTDSTKYWCVGGFAVGVVLTTVITYAVTRATK